MSASAQPPRSSAALMLAVLSAVLVAYLLVAVGRKSGDSTDYSQDYISARALATGVSIYEPLSEELAGVAEKPRVRVNDHPPPYVVALAPLAVLPYPAAYVLLAAFCLLAVVGSGLVVGASRGWGLVGGLAVVLLLLLHPGTGTGVVYGNISSLLLGLIVLAWWAAGRGRSVLAGASIGLAAGLKLFPGLLGVAFIITRDWRAALVAGSVALACWVAAAAVAGVEDVRTYVVDRAPENARMFAPSAFNLSVAGVAHRTFGEPDPNTPWLDRAAVRPELIPLVLWGLRGLVLAIVAVAFLRTGRATTADRAFAVLLPAMLLLSPLTWLHALPMVAVTVAHLAARATTRPRRAALGACILALMVSDVWVGMWLSGRFGYVPWWGNFAMLTPTWGLFGVLVLTAAWGSRGERQDRPPRLG